MTLFDQPDIVPLWDRPAEFLPLRPVGGSYRWHYSEVRSALERAGHSLDPNVSERRVALLAHPDLHDAATVEGINAGIQLLHSGERATVHRHSPAALRVGLFGTDVVTMVNDQEFHLDPLDVVLNPSGTWHGHEARGTGPAAWLDVVDLPMVRELGGVLFEPSPEHSLDDLLDPPTIPSNLRFAWADAEAHLAMCPSVDGVRRLDYNDGIVMPTLAVTAFAFDAGSTLRLPARTGGAVLLAGRGTFDSPDGPIATSDIVALRSWTPYSITATSADGVAVLVDTSPTMRSLGLYREEITP